MMVRDHFAVPQPARRLNSCDLVRSDCGAAKWMVPQRVYPLGRCNVRLPNRDENSVHSERKRLVFATRTYRGCRV
jgi:hypothetical protein